MESIKTGEIDTLYHHKKRTKCYYVTSEECIYTRTPEAATLYINCSEMIKTKILKAEFKSLGHPGTFRVTRSAKRKSSTISASSARRQFIALECFTSAGFVFLSEGMITCSQNKESNVQMKFTPLLPIKGRQTYYSDSVFEGGSISKFPIETYPALAKLTITFEISLLQLRQGRRTLKRR